MVIKALEEGKRVTGEKEKDLYSGLPELNNPKQQIGGNENECNQNNVNSVKTDPSISSNTGTSVSGSNLDSGSEYISSGNKGNNRVEKYPGFDFNTQGYFIGQTVFFIKTNRLIGEKSFHELKIRSIYPKFMVGVEKDAHTCCMGPDVADRIFTNQADAIDFFNALKVPAKYSGYSEENNTQQEDV